MKDRLILHTIFLLLLLTVASFSCRTGPGNNGGNGGPPGSPVSSPSNSPTVPPGNDNANIGKLDSGQIDNSVANADTAMIFKVDNEVLLKTKGAADFVRILNGLFRSGDVLRVGQQAIAWVTCPDGHVCPLNSGEYTNCCNVACANPIQMRPPPSKGDEPRVMMRRIDLPPADRQQFERAELQIRQLHTDDVTEQFLIANLYSSWKLTEAKDEVKKLSEQLKDPKAPDKLKQLYLPMVRKTGDLYFKIDQKGEAERNYNKVIELAPKVKDEKETAAAHSSLGQLYETTGQKEAAVKNLEKATVIYDKEGDTQKATQVRRTITKVQKE
ncbi:MAG TPA: tetratricopeptide repeat protein [Pyrinomonadaceae bacterium]|jgi:tetratricopeptide (TPR) repeat protein